MTTLERQAIIHAGPWILFDGICNLCNNSATRLSPIVRRRGFRLTPLQSHIGKEFRTPADEMQVITRRGTVVGGVEAFAYIARHIWWAAPFALLLYIPFARRLLNPLYRLLAANRYRISGTCPLRHDSEENPYSVEL